MTASGPAPGVVRLADCLNMTIAVDWDVKLQANQTNKSSRLDAIKIIKWSSRIHGVLDQI